MFTSKNFTDKAIPTTAKINLPNTESETIFPNDLFLDFKAFLNKTNPVKIYKNAINHPNPTDSKLLSEISSTNSDNKNVVEMIVIP